ncbi:MAG: glycerate kinase [Candidatus Hodarchaeota archaeon]
MVIQNQQELLKGQLNNKTKKSYTFALKLAENMFKAINPAHLIHQNIQFDSSSQILSIGEWHYDLDQRHVIIIGGGKASGTMVQELERIIPSEIIVGGCVNVPKEQVQAIKTDKIEIIGAGHPLPDPDGVKGVKRIISYVKTAKEEDLIICLISGGASAMLPDPVPGISLDDLQNFTDLLLRCGATIHEINACRKHIGSIKGGQLAHMAASTMVCLILSDVIGDNLGTIASGPTSPDPSTFQDVRNIFTKYNLWSKIPVSVKQRIELGLQQEISETPKPGNPIFDRIHNHIIGNNRLACLTILEMAKRASYNTVLLTSLGEGEAREVGTFFGTIAREVKISDHPIPAPAVIVFGGETTVKVLGKGKGGRNQELAVATARKIDNTEGIVIVSLGTDGFDGPTDCAGAIVHSQTMNNVREKGLSIEMALKNNDCYPLLKSLISLIFTGVTGTNVADVTFAVIN